MGYTLAGQLASRQSTNGLLGGWTVPPRSDTYATANGRNQYTTVAGRTYTHDANGNLTTNGLRTYGYDVENRLTSASGSPATTLTYDPLGRLRQTVAGSLTTQFLYEGDRLIAEYNGSGSLLRRYVHGPGVDEPLVWYEGAALTDRRWLHTDERGSVIAQTNGSGTATPYSYGAYGEPSSWTGSRFRYTGQIMLPEAQLYHYKARVYDPQDGRFLQTDPIGYADDYNLYAYVGSDPLNFVDSSGRSALAIHFRDQPIRAGDYVIPQWISGGHSGVTMINDKTGYTAYREFGRYNGPGSVRRQTVPNLQLGRDGVPTVRSVEKLLSAILDIGAKASSDDIEITYTLGSDYAAMQAQSQEWHDRRWNPIGRNTCHGYCDDVVEAGGDGPSVTSELTRENISDVAKSIIGLYKENNNENTSGWLIDGDLIMGTGCSGRLACGD